jgi:hypothetical protein
MSDRLAMANAIEDAGIPRDKAERLASVLHDAFREGVAAKADIASLATRADVEASAAKLRGEIAAVATDVRAVVRAELQAVRTDVHAVRTELKDELALTERRLLTRLGGLIVVAVGVLFAALHWPITGR